MLAAEVPSAPVHVIPGFAPVDTPTDHTTAALTSTDKAQTIKATAYPGRDILKVIPLTDAPGLIEALIRIHELQYYVTTLVNTDMMETNPALLHAIKEAVQ